MEIKISEINVFFLILFIISLQFRIFYSSFLFVLNTITFQMCSISSTTIYKNILLQLLAFPFTKVEITIFV